MSISIAKDIKKFMEEHVIVPEQTAYIDSLFDKTNPNRLRIRSGIDTILDLYYNDEKDLLDKILASAEKHDVEWCKKLVSMQEKSPLPEINAEIKREYNYIHWKFSGKFAVTGLEFKHDMRGIVHVGEYAGSNQEETFKNRQPDRDKYREAIFDLIAKGETYYGYEELKKFYLLSDEEKKKWICQGNDWSDSDTKVLETAAYKRAMRRIEYETVKLENKELFAINDFIKFTGEQKNLVLEFTDSKEVAKAIIDTYKGNIEYNDLIARHFTRGEFEQAVEDYKITQYRRDNERLKAENAQMKEDVAKEWEKIRQENDKILTTKGKLLQERNEVAEEAARVRAKSAEIAFIKDIDKVNKNGPDEFDTNRKKELFAKMKEEMLKNPNLREGHLAAMCKIYASRTNTPEQKAEYFEGLHEVRKSGTTNAEKREMARTFGRVLERNPELAKDEALKGLAKIDYSAVGYTPTKRGFLKNQKQTTK